MWSIAKLSFNLNYCKTKKILITAGPTREAIDPVRFISNHSSGKMGYALAKAAQQLGAEVTIVSGPVALAVPNETHCINVDSAQEMYDAVMANSVASDIFIACAAVADYRPANIEQQKKSKRQMTATLCLSA